jgi:chromosome segregation ATPase
LHTLQSNVNRATAGINARHNELERIDKDILASEAELIDGGTTTERRVILLAELKNLSERIGELDSEIEDLYQQRARYQMELEQYQVALVDYGY